MRPFYLTFLFLILSHFMILAQGNFSGRVSDKITGEGLEGAVVLNMTNSTHCICDQKGGFMLPSVKPGDSITVRIFGYRGKSFSYFPGKDLHIELEKGALDLKEVVVNDHSHNLISSRIFSRLDLNIQPVRSAQDLLRLVPGLFIAQHQGEGKAEQIFLRGFDADHGTDVNISVDGMPVNMVSHAHGQGYADLHFLIPETVASYDFGKGPYYAAKGDFCTAGYVSYKTINFLDKNLVKVEGGQFNSARIVSLINLLGDSARKKGQSAYIAAEGLYSDGGPYALPEHFKRFNLFGKFITPIDSNNTLTLILSSLYSTWRSAGEIPNRAIQEGYIANRFGVLDSAQGGTTTRTNASVKLVSRLGNDLTLENQVYYAHNYFNLISNFTFYYADPIHGDEFNQHESRNLYGFNSHLNSIKSIGQGSLSSTLGIGIRYDKINNLWLAQTQNGNFLDYIQLGRGRETNAHAYLDETFESGKFFFDLGLRLDYFQFYYQNEAPDSDTSAGIFLGRKTSTAKSILSPKFNVEYTLNSQFQFYVKLGKGFHSNDIRVVIANSGFQTLPPAYGMDLGLNWKPSSRLFINTALWYLFLQQEFTYGQDFGAQSVEPSGRTIRKGFDFSARYQITDWLFANVNLDLAVPKALDSIKGHNFLPLAPTKTSTAGLFFRCKDGWNGGFSYRYLHDRAANSDYSLIARGYFVNDITLNYTRPRFEIGLSIQNLFNVVWNESQFEYVSQLKNEKAPVDEVSYTPGLPFFGKVHIAWFF